MKDRAANQELIVIALVTIVDSIFIRRSDVIELQFTSYLSRHSMLSNSNSPDESVRTFFIRTDDSSSGTPWDTIFLSPVYQT
jgi:hypothetical protein